MLNLLQEAPPSPICSRTGCTEPAQHALRWANPKIHHNGREKIWLACDKHLSYLRDFLTARNFLNQVTGVHELD